MVDAAWKERITRKKKIELEKRGVETSKTPEENKALLKEVEERGGIVSPATNEAIGIEAVGVQEKDIVSD